MVIDLETTGLKAGSDEITEVGAVKFSDGEVLAEYTKLVNPKKPIPWYVQQKTGITTEMVKKAPRFEWIRDEVIDFLGDRPVLGYNLPFDLSFLRKQGIKVSSASYDVLEIARRRLPRRTKTGRKRRYRLDSIARDLNIPLRRSHRALDDAHTTMEVFKRLITKT